MTTSQITICILGIATTLLCATSFAQVVNFTYSGDTGPPYWSQLSPAYAACSKGRIQSPINIETNDAVYNPNLLPQLLYGEGVGSVLIDGKKHNLLQSHWHSPSEHTIDGIRYDVELHLVHKSDDNTTLSVISILYRLGKPDSFVSQVKDQLHKMNKKVRIWTVKKVPIKLVRTEELKCTIPYYRYLGSLTAPPCTEQVIWTILGQVREISKQQVAALKAALGKSYQRNARPLQKLNGRRVEAWK
ncbi:alpha carbonic anhydrase 1, chloroplastic-like [Papaver somniferum]|uniref:alpha carbonic anhydrase 1, chloroplastic-like n=1 Tax=Papaver somniferum TaxID=3469 RepID=UPI000E6F8439|nr:alpha carbonic anhydrase 1, chloroplastic-like [Papaver somniferum]